MFCAFHDLHVAIPIQLPQRNSASAAHVCAADALFLCGSWASCLPCHAIKAERSYCCAKALGPPICLSVCNAEVPGQIALVISKVIITRIISHTVFVPRTRSPTIGISKFYDFMKIAWCSLSVIVRPTWERFLWLSVAMHVQLTETPNSSLLKISPCSPGSRWMAFGLRRAKVLG